MADESSPNAMQAHLGLLSSAGSFSPVGMPTPAPPVPQVRHPGEISSSVVAQAQTQAAYTMGGGRAPPPPPGYADAYRANMGAINNQMFGTPFYAQMVARMTGSPGFNAAMMPSPTQFTDPSLGIFRPFPAGPVPMIPPVPQLPLIQHPMVPTPPAPRFQTPFEYIYNYQQMRADQIQSTAHATPGIAARTGSAWAGSTLGAGAGAALGGLLFGGVGARIGSVAGALGGLALSEYSGVGPAFQHMVDRMNPARTMGLRGAQMQGMSADWVVGGDALSPVGTGWHRQAGIRAGRLIEDLAYDRGFRNDTRQSYSVQDLTRITQAAGRAGLLDFAQSPEAVRDEVRKIAVELKAFMQIANEPDVREAVKQLGQMRSMGLSSTEAVGATVNARMFARMAGTSIRGLTETAGLPGAMLFQQMGLSAGLGLQVGQGMYGMSRQAVAAGAYSVQDLGMLGGAQGIAQRNTESALATLRIPLLAAAMSNIGASGTWGLNTGSITKMLGGKLSIEDMARMGVGNLHSAVSEHGISGLGMFLMQQREMQDSLGRAIGPMGMKHLQMQTVLAAQKQLGFDKTPGGVFMAAKSLGLDDDQAKQFVKEANSPSYFANMRRQMEVQIRELKMLAQDQHERQRGGLFYRNSRQRGVLYDVSHSMNRMASGLRTGFERFNEFFSELGEDAMLPSGMVPLRTAAELDYANDDQRRVSRDRGGRSRIGRHAWRDAYAAEGGRAAFFEGAHQYGVSETLRHVRDQYLGGDADVFSELKRRRGGWSAYVPTWLLRAATPSTGAQNRAELEGYDAASADVARGTHASLAEREDTWKQLEKAGVSRADINSIARRLGNRGSEIAAHSGKSASVHQSHIDWAIQEATGLSQEKRNLLMKSGAFRGLIAGTASERYASHEAENDFFNPNRADVLLKEGHLTGGRAAARMLSKATSSLLGSDNTEATGLFKDLSAEKDARVVTALGLLADQKAGTGDGGAALEAFTKTLGADEEAVMGRARGLLKAHQGQEKFLAHMGKVTRNAEKDASKYTAAVRGAINYGREGIYFNKVRAGVGALGLSADAAKVMDDFAAGGVDGNFALAALQKFRGDIKDAKLVELIDRAQQGDKKAAGDLERYLHDRGDGGAPTAVGVGRNTAAATRLQAQAGQNAALQGELASNFPEAVNVFAEAAEKLRQAADAIGGRYPTAYTGTGDTGLP